MTSPRTPAAPRRTAVVGAAAGLVLPAGLVMAPWLTGFGGAGVLALSDTLVGVVLSALAIALAAVAPGQFLISSQSPAPPPGRYGLSARFATTPGRPCWRLAPATASPPPR